MKTTVYFPWNTVHGFLAGSACCLFLIYVKLGLQELLQLFQTFHPIFYVILLIFIFVAARSPHPLCDTCKKGIGQKLLQARQRELHLRRTLYEQLSCTEEPCAGSASRYSKPFRQDDRWQKVRDNTDRAFDDFTLRLKQAYPAIKTEQLNLSCLVLMGLDNAEIAQQLNLSKVNARQRKTRLRAILGIKNQDIDLQVFLQDF